MKRFALPILGILLLVPASLHAQVGYGGYQGNPYQGASPYGGGASPYGGYYPGPNSYGPRPATFAPAIGLLNPNGPGGTAIRYASTVANGQGLRYQQNQFDRVFQSTALGPPPLGANEEDLFATIPAAGHFSGYNNTLGYYPLNGRTTTSAGQRPQTPQQPAKKTQQ